MDRQQGSDKADLGRKLILVVDDEAINRQVLTIRLQGAGYDVIEAENATRALDLIRTKPVDLILLDIMMPDTNGIDLLKLIRVDYSGIDLPVIMVTALDDSERVVEAMELGASDYLVKPLDFTVAKARIRAQLEHKQAIEALRASPGSEQQLRELKSRFISMVSHELRTPLTIILSSAELMELKAKKTLRDDWGVYFERIKSGVEHMNELLDDLLLAGAGENGRLRPQTRSIDLLSLCQGIVDGMRHTGREDRVISLRLVGEPVEVCLDPKLVTLIVQNLVSNSVKYSPPGSPIEVTVRYEDEQVSLAVRDAGIGIPECEISQVLQMFYRAGNAVGFPGSGLGLAMVKGCAEAQHGTIQIDSTVGEGTEITVAFPQARNEAEPDPVVSCQGEPAH